MNSKLLALALCMFCGMSFLSANGAIDAKTEETEVSEEVTVSDEVAKAEQTKAKKTKDDKATVQESKSCSGCK